MERTLVLIKPDGVQRSLSGEIIKRFENAGLKIAGIKMVWADEDFAEKHYREDLEIKYKDVLEKYGKDLKIINEVGAEQSLYFNQLFEAEKMLGWIKDGQRVHVRHGLYRFKDVKMSTRKGNVIFLEDLL